MNGFAENRKRYSWRVARRGTKRYSVIGARHGAVAFLRLKMISSNFIVKDRGDEVHDSGSSRSVAGEEIAVYDMYSDTSGTVTISAPPITSSALPPHPACKPRYVLTIAGTQWKATEACAEYLGLLNRMVEKFMADHP
jgi:hypothetical protein